MPDDTAVAGRRVRLATKRPCANPLPDPHIDIDVHTSVLTAVKQHRDALNVVWSALTAERTSAPGARTRLAEDALASARRFIDVVEPMIEGLPGARA